MARIDRVRAVLERVVSSGRPAGIYARDAQAILDALGRLRAQIDEAKRERDGLAFEVGALRHANLRYRRMKNDPWRWMGDGTDDLESISVECPVLITSDDLRAVFADLAAAREALKLLDAILYFHAVPMIGSMPEPWLSRVRMYAIELEYRNDFDPNADRAAAGEGESDG